MCYSDRVWISNWLGILTICGISSGSGNPTGSGILIWCGMVFRLAFQRGVVSKLLKVLPLVPGWFQSYNLVSYFNWCFVILVELCCNICSHKVCWNNIMWKTLINQKSGCNKFIQLNQENKSYPISWLGASIYMALWQKLLGVGASCHISQQISTNMVWLDRWFNAAFNHF